MTKLVIKRREDAKETSGLRFSDYETTIDGVEIEHLTELKLDMGVDTFNQCSLTFFVDSVEVDANFVAAVEAHVNDKKKLTAESYTIKDNKVYLDGKEVE